MTSKTLTTTLIVMMAMAVLVAGCSDDSTSPQSGADVENGILSTEELKAALSRIPVGEPGADEIADLLFMREKEKLAHDVYTVLFEQYGQKIFTNIAASEQKHTDAILMLLGRYGQEDPVGDNGPGVFTNEEIDILDLEEAMAGSELRAILMVYGNLLKGSHNHLRAFVRVHES